MNLNDWLTIKQAAVRAETSSQAIHGLANRGVLASLYVGRTRLIGRASFNAWLAARPLNTRSRSRPRAVVQDDSYTVPELEALGQGTLEPLAEQPTLDVDGEWSGLAPVTLSVEARRAYDASPAGQRDARLIAEYERVRGVV